MIELFLPETNNNFYCGEKFKIIIRIMIQKLNFLFL